MSVSPKHPTAPVMLDKNPTTKNNFVIHPVSIPPLTSCKNAAIKNVIAIKNPL